jgi:predicted dienelactone hydrolase
MAGMRRISRLVAGFGVSALITSVALAVPAAASAAAPFVDQPMTRSAAVQLALPVPTGPHAVGIDTLDLVDPHRADPWNPAVRRELMVSVWYPARRVEGAPAPYMTAAESRLFLQGVSGVPADVLTTVETHAHVDAPPLPGSRKLPLVVLSPGLGDPRATLTGLAEELASHGYVVAGIDHTYESSGVSFPDGRVAECLVCGQDIDGAAVTAGRARDVSFVLNRLLARPSAWSGGGAINAHRIAMVGHSIGGASALSTMLTDRRVDAGVNLDGSFFPPLGAPFRRPFLMISNETHGPGTDPSWTDTWQQLRGWKRWLSVTGTTHSSFTDIAPLADQIGQPIQALAGERASEITRAYVTAYLDLQLRGRAQPTKLLNGPSAQYPEVHFVTP